MLAPALLALPLLAVLLIVPAVYAINVNALRNARLFSETGPAYRRNLLAYIKSFLLIQEGIVDPEPGLERKHFFVQERRLRNVELSKLVLGTVFGISTILFLLITREAQGSGLLNITFVLFGFLAVTYTFQGAQGVSVLVTTVNRNLPSIVRARKKF